MGLRALSPATGAARRLRSHVSKWAAIALVAASVVALPIPGARAEPRDGRSAPVILVVGDSISAGYGLEPGQGWVDLLASRLRRDGYPQRVVNASISGDTSAGGRARLPALLREYRPAIVVVELGGNDGLRGGDPAITRGNLDAMVKDARTSRAGVLVLGMKMPPNYGPAYARAFDAIYPELARTPGVVLVPWIFAGFGGDLSQFQPDHIHPVAATQSRILDNVWPALLPLIETRTNAGRRGRAG